MLARVGDVPDAVHPRRDVEAPLVVVTVWPHPVSVLRPEQAPKLLTDLRTRIDLLNFLRRRVQ